jgi:hypothetical protein
VGVERLPGCRLLLLTAIAYAVRLVELARHLLQACPRGRQPSFEVGDALGDLLLTGGQDRDLAVGGPQLGTGRVDGRLQPGPLGRAPAAAPLLEVDRVTAPSGQHGQGRARGPVAVARVVGVAQGDDVRDVDGAEPGVAERLDERAGEDRGLRVLVRDERRQGLAHLLGDTRTEPLALLVSDLGDAVGEGVDPPSPLPAEHPELVGVEGALRLTEQVGEGAQLVDLVAVLADEVVDRPRGHRRLAQRADRRGQGLLAGGPGLRHHLCTQRREAGGRVGLQLVYGGAQVQDHPCILPQTRWCARRRTGRLGG